MAEAADTTTGNVNPDKPFDVFENDVEGEKGEGVKGEGAEEGADKNGNDKTAANGGKRGGTVWVQVLVGSEKIGQPSEFPTPHNVDALKRKVKEDYAELKDMSPARFQVFHSSVTREGCATPLAANSFVPLMAVYDDPIKVVAPVPKIPRYAAAPAPMPATTTTGFPEPPIKRGRGRPSRKSTLSVEQYKAAMMAQASGQSPTNGATLSPATATPTYAAVAAGTQHVPNRKRPLEDYEWHTTTGEEHDAMKMRTGTSRRCTICMRRTVYECTHEDCQARIKSCGMGKELYGFPICGRSSAVRVDTEKYGPYNTKTCLQIHTEKQVGRVHY
ncbi:expressed unknown protein [Seminavis robusta]|uniref:Uncharacterized protein n=1 Tax=Seminavis robusta TaxID=568900 RepID=A0A9N8EI93_9STRA|nr:expressed unknown protein [Seminavis robusta]|eukprot:Sro978_g227170.1 n/a (330) ;mRNA; r:30004-31353